MGEDGLIFCRWGLASSITNFHFMTSFSLFTLLYYSFFSFQEIEKMIDTNKRNPFDGFDETVMSKRITLINRYSACVGGGFLYQN